MIGGLIPIDEVVTFDVALSNPTTGAEQDADSTPTYNVFEDASDTPILAAQNMTKRTSQTGNYRGTFTASAANGFEAGKWYNVVAEATVATVTSKYVAGTFRCAPAEVVAGVPLVDLSYWLGVAPLALSSQRVQVLTVAISNGAIAAATFAANALDAVWSTATRTLSSLSNVAADIRAAVGLASANLDAQLAAIQTSADGAATPAEVNAEVLDVLATDTFAEPTGVPPATTTLATKIGRLYQALRNGLDVTATDKTFKNAAGVALWRKPLSDDGSTYTEGPGATP